LTKTTRKVLPKVESTATSVKPKGNAKAISLPPAPAPVPTSGGGEDDCASDDEDSHDETELSPASTPIEGKAKKSRPLGILYPSKSLEVTLFDRMEKMWGEEIKQMLTVQYR
jgi:DNA polymerase alpha-associated DNA helicase A